MGDLKRVLIIEDEDLLASLIQRMLSRLGFETFAATTGSEGLRELKRLNQDLDLIVVDYNLPDISSNDIIHQVHLLSPSLKILLTSGYPLDMLTGIKRDDINGFLAKPFNFDQIRSTVTTLFA
ncbi:MAG: response regulator [Myxococcales bacterium]|nr:response regulator [Myxococcales bacterium]